MNQMGHDSDDLEDPDESNESCEPDGLQDPAESIVSGDLGW